MSNGHLRPGLSSWCQARMRCLLACVPGEALSLSLSAGPREGKGPVLIQTEASWKPPLGLEWVGSLPDLPACLLSSCLLIMPKREGGSDGSGGRGALGWVWWKHNPSGWHCRHWSWGGHLTGSQQHRHPAAFRKSQHPVLPAVQVLSLPVFTKRLLCALRVFVQRQGGEGL